MFWNLLFWVVWTIPTVTAKRYAYVTVHYEGTTRDAEYVLGIQVMMQSIKLTNTKHDLIVLASNTVTEQSKALFRQIGCRVIDVKNIANPFIDSTLKNKNFIFTLNKLHVWNLLEYDRVVYLDADNVVLRNADELFECGDFCAVFMNPCHFHTGLLVITPNEQQYNYLLRELNHVGSFDGADQGFLSSVYTKKLRESPLFLKEKHNQTSSTGCFRLSVGYNINHKYYYEQYHWRLFMLRHFSNMTLSEENYDVPSVVVERGRSIPAITMGYPMTPLLKPWYWWSVVIMDLNNVWHDIRSTIPNEDEQFHGLFLIKANFFHLIFFCTFILVLAFGLHQFVPSTVRLRVLCIVLNEKWNGYLIRIVFILFCYYYAGKPIHRLAIASYGICFYILNQHVLFLMINCILSFYINPPHPHLYFSLKHYIPTILYRQEFWQLFFISFIAHVLVYLLTQWNSIYMNILWKLIVCSAGFLGCIIGQVYILTIIISTTTVSGLVINKLPTGSLHYSFEKKTRANSHQA